MSIWFYIFCISSTWLVIIALCIVIKMLDKKLPQYTSIESIENTQKLILELIKGEKEIEQKRNVPKKPQVQSES